MSGDTNRTFRNQEVLIVEDELLIALDLERIVKQLGYIVLGPAASIEKALDLLSRSSPSAALLDINLSGVLVVPVAKACQDRGIPFLLVTGYGRLSLQEPILDSAPRIHEPFDKGSIKSALVDLIEN